MTEITKQRIIKTISAVVLLESCLVMAGWIFNVYALTIILPIGINMAFATASVFFFCAIALYLMFRAVKDNYELSSVILPGIALFLFLIVGTILADSISGVSSGIESLFVKTESSIYIFGSGWPSFFTMADFILFGAAIIVCLSYFPGRQKIIKLIGRLLLILGILPLVGYLSSVHALYLDIYNLTPIALNTAFLFFLLGCGLVVIGGLKIKYET